MLRDVFDSLASRIRKLECQEPGAGLVAALIPIGGIILWSGAIADIPTDYQICDGTNGTPDLRDMFVVGAGNTYAVGDSATFADGATYEYYALSYIMRVQ